MSFCETEKINVTSHVEKKGKFSYLSWPFAVSELRKNYPEGWWEIVRSEGKTPYLETTFGVYVEVKVFTHKACPGFSQIHPVLDYKNQPVDVPTAFQINTSIQRCLVKAIALATGIGLHIYAGEDLPPAEPKPKSKRRELDDKLNEDGFAPIQKTEFIDHILKNMDEDKTTEAIAEEILKDYKVFTADYYKSHINH